MTHIYAALLATARGARVAGTATTLDGAVSMVADRDRG